MALLENRGALRLRSCLGLSVGKWEVTSRIRIWGLLSGRRVVGEAGVLQVGTGDLGYPW